MSHAGIDGAPRNLLLTRFASRIHMDYYVNLVPLWSEGWPFTPQPGLSELAGKVGGITVLPSEPHLPFPTGLKPTRGAGPERAGRRAG